MDLSLIKAKIESTPELMSLEDNYPGIAYILNEKPLVSNPEEPSQVPDLPEFRELLEIVLLGQPKEYAAIESISSLREWALVRLDGDAEITEAEYVQAKNSLEDFNIWASAKIGVAVIITALEFASISSVFDLRSWLRRQGENEAVVDVSPETKQQILMLQSTLPYQIWDGPATEVIRFCLSNLLTLIPRIDGKPFLGEDGRVITTLSLLGSIFLEQEVISQETFNSMLILLTKTKDDPNYSKTIQTPSWAESNGYVSVTPEMIRRSKNMKFSP